MAVFERAGRRVCLGCVFRSGCWKRELAATRKALRPAAEGMEKQGTGGSGGLSGGLCRPLLPAQ